MDEPTNMPRPASTVVLLRERGGGLQAYLLKRSAGGGFFPGSYVFPGGAVDSGDRDEGFWLKHSDLDRSAIEKRLGTRQGAEGNLAYAVAALRETFEEAGVMLATRRAGERLDSSLMRECRVAGKLGKGWFREWVAAEQILLSVSSLTGWSHWITPEAFRPRFDTRFFLAFMPDGQECAPDTRETTVGRWIEPRGALQGNMQGGLPLSPPTIVTLQEILECRCFTDLDNCKRACSWETPRLPRLIRLSRGAIIIEPWDAMIQDEITVEEEKMKELVLPVGTPFSRIWLHDGIWRPVGSQ